MKALSRIAAAALVFAYGCAARYATVNQRATTFERAYYESCAAAVTAPLTPGRLSLFCGCSAGVALASTPPELVAKAGLSPAENATMQEIGRDAGKRCAPVVVNTAAQCEAQLTSVPPGAARTNACDCVIGELVTEFSPTELALLARQATSEVTNAQARLDASYQRCAGAYAADSAGTDWSLVLSIGSALLSAGALAASLAAATSAPDTTYFVLPNR